MRATALRQPLEGIKALASLGGGAIVLWVVYLFGGEYLTLASNAAPGGGAGAEMNAWFNTGLDTVLPLAFIGLAFFGLVATAVLNRRYA